MWSSAPTTTAHEEHLSEAQLYTSLIKNTEIWLGCWLTALTLIFFNVDVHTGQDYTMDSSSVAGICHLHSFES